MSNPILEGMIRKRSGHIIACKDRPDQFNVEKEALRAALLYLADNVSDEMLKAASNVWKNDQSSGSFEELLQFVIAAALRQAAGGE